MKAACWNGKQDIRVETVPDPAILNPRDAIVRITRTAICGSDLHMYNGHIPGMKAGDIVGHEFAGEVVETGPEVKQLQTGDRVVVPFAIACGQCFFCRWQLWSLCDNSNPHATRLETVYGQSGGGLFGYSHLYGGYAGGQAQYARVPFADIGPLKIPEGMDEERALFLSDILPTGYMAAEQCDIQPGDTVAVWGCGPVGLFAQQSAGLLGAGQVIGIDRIPERLEKAREQAGSITLNYAETGDLVEELKILTGGRGPDRCIDAVGMEAHSHGFEFYYDNAKQMLKLESDRPVALRQAIQACRKGGTVSIPGVYGGGIDQAPLGAAFAKGLTLKMGQTHVHRYMRPLLERIEKSEIDPTFVITHRAALERAPEMYRTFAEKRDGCIKVVMDPWAQAA